MFDKRFALAAIAVLALMPDAGRAQGDPPEPPMPTLTIPPPPAPEAPCCTVPARTVIEIEITDTVNSKTNSSRDSFAFRLAEPLAVDGRVLVPAGTPGVGEVVHAARARAGGKAGELILAARYLEHNGTRIPLRSLRYGPSQGRDNSGSVMAGAMVAAATIPMASMIGYLIAGGEVNVPAGTRANAQTAAELVLAPVGQD